MESLVIKPSAQPLYTVRPEASHPRISLRRVLYVKFLRWVDQASPRALRRAVLSLLTTLGIILLIIAPQLLLGLCYSAMSWHHYGIVKVLIVLAAVGHWKTMWKLWKRVSNRRSGNQHTYHGLPIDDLASYLCEHRSFKVEHAMKHFGISQDKHAAIAGELQKHAVLIRGENNARVLNTITRDELVRQLREKFPLVWSEDRNVWAERNGTFERWTMEKDRKEREEREKVEKLERKKAKLKADIAHQKSGFQLAFEQMA